MRILVVDKNPDNAAVACRILGNRHSTINAYSSTECIQKARENLPDLIILDETIDGKHGLEVMQGLRNKRVTSEIPVIILTDDGHDTERMVRWLEHGAFDWIVKPVTDTIVQAKVRIVQRLRQRDEALSWESKLNAALAELDRALVEQSPPVDEISGLVLDYAKKLTQSEYGFAASIDPETGTCIAHTIAGMMEECRVNNELKKITFPRGKNGRYPGLWGHALNTKKPFYTNTPKTHESSMGTPDGHIRIKRFLAVPAMIGNEPIGLLALANPEKPYTVWGLNAVTRIAVLYALALQRLRTHEELIQYQQHLEDQVKRRTANLAKANEKLKDEIKERRKFELVLKHTNEKLLREHIQRKILSKRIIDVLEKDRRQIAMELHDHIGQSLTSFKIGLELIHERLKTSDSGLASQIDDIRERTITIMRDVKKISLGLRPGTLDTLGLLPSLRELCRAVENDTGIETVFFTRGIPGQIDTEKELALYRIAQEALTNVIKYAGAKQVFINLVRKDESILLSIEDDGVGFDKEQIMSEANSGGHSGLLIMKERAAQLDGELIVESQVGRGTVVSAEIPL